MKPVLPGIIFESQSAFISRRLMSVNTIGALKTLHSMKQILKGKKGRVAIDLDIYKAYDSMDGLF